MGLSTRSKTDPGFDFNTAFDEAAGGKPTPQQKGQQQIASPGIDFNAAFDNAVKKKVGGGESPSSSGGAIVSPSDVPSPSPESINNSFQAFKNKKATTEDIDVLATTDYGKQNGFNTMSDKAKSVFVAAHNGVKVSDLHDEAFNIINQQYPKTGDPNKDKIRDQIMQGFQTADPAAIIKVQKSVDDSYQQQINILDAQQQQRRTDIQGMRPDPRMAQQQKSILDASKEKLLAEQKKTKETLQAYGAYTLTKTGAFQNFIDSELSNPSIKKSVAAISLGKQMDQSFGIPKTTNNTEYNQAKAGLGQMLVSLNMEINDLYTQGIKTKNADILKQADEKVEKLKRYANIYNTLDAEQYPDVGRQHTARFLSDVLSEMGQNKVYTSRDDVYKAAKYAQEKYGFDLKKYGPLVDLVAQSEGSGITSFASGDIASPGFRGGLEKGAASAVYNFADVADWFLPKSASHAKEREAAKETEAGFKGTSQSGGYPTKIVYDADGKAFRETNNEHYGQVDWNNAYRFLGESLPSLAEFVALDKGIGKVAKGTAEYGLKGVNAFGKGVTEVTNSLIGAKDLEAGYKALRLSKKFEQTAGLLGSTYFTSYDENHKQAEEWIKDTSSEGEAKKNAVANLLTLTQFAAFKAMDYSPSRMVEKLISKQVLPDALDVLEKSNWEKLTGQQKADFFKDKVLPRVQAFAAKGAANLKSGAKVGAATVASDKMKDIIGSLVSPESKGSDAAENAQTFIEQSLLMTVVGLPGMVKSGAFPHTSKDALYEAGLYGPQYIDRINDRVSAGMLDQDKANGMIQMVKTMHEEINKAGFETNDKGLPTITRQKKDIAIANFRKRAATMMEEKGMDIGGEKVTGEADKEIKTVKAENFNQSIEESPTFKSVKAEETGKAPASVEDIKPEEKYTYDKTGEPVTTTGAELINHLENGDIYEKDDQNKSKNPEVKDTENKVSASEEAKGEGPKVVDEAPILEKAKLAIEEATKDGKLGTYSETLKDEKNIKPFLKEVTDQIQGVTADGTKSVLPDAEKAAREQYGDGVVDAAKEMYPETKESPKTVKEGDTVSFGGKDWKVTEDNGDTVKIADPETNSQTTIPKEEAISRLKEQPITSPIKTDNYGNEKNSQKSDAQEGSQKSGEEVQKDAEGNVLTSESEQGAGAKPETAPNSEVKEHTVKFNKATGEYEVISPKGSIMGSYKDEDEAHKLKDDINEAMRPEEPPPAEPAAEQPKAAEAPQTTGIRDSIVNAERVHKGLRELVKEFTRSWAENWNDLKNNIANGFDPRQFIEETGNRLANGERVAFTDYDYAALLFDRLNIQNNIAIARDGMEEARNAGNEADETAATDLFNLHTQQLEQNDIVGRQLKSESGRALSALQMMANMDGQLVSWTKNLENLYRGNMPETLKSFAERIEKEYKEKTEQLKEHYENELKKVAEDAFKRAKKDVFSRGTSANQSVNKKSIKVQGKELADKIRKLRPGTDAAQANVFGLPIAIYDTAILTIANAIEGGAKLVDAINEAIKDIKFNSDKDKYDFIAHLQNIEEPESMQAKRANLIEDIKSISKENDVTSLSKDAVKPLRQLMNNYIKDGQVKTLDELVKKTYDDLKDTLPDIDEKDIRDAFSGYGMKPDSEGKMKSDLSKLREQARDVSKYQELLKKPAGETPAQEYKRLTKAAELLKKVNDYMREMGIQEQPPPATVEGRKAVALEKVKKRTRSIIKGLEDQIAAGERKQRNGVEPDSELNVLKAERDQLSKQLDEIDKSKQSPEEKIKRTEDTLNRQIFNYEKQIKDGTNPLRPKEQRPTTKQIEQLKRQKAELKRQVDRMREENNPQVSEQAKALAKYNENAQKKIWQLEDKIANKDFSPPEQKKVVDFTRNEESLKLERRLKQLQGDYHSMRKAGELVNRKWYQKVMSLAAATKRAFVLSRISTFGRLGAAVAWNSVFKPAETISGFGIYAAGKAGFANKLSQQADRYGITSMNDVLANVVGEGKAWGSLFNAQTWKDFVSDAKNGYSELSLMYGDKVHSEVPKELRDHWQNIEHGLEAFGRAHGAVKGVAKRMEFNRSYVIRKEAARRKQQDVANPVVQASIGAMAYKDAMRSILMESNWLSDKYQAGITELQKGGFGANALALTLQEIMPIVKIPTNLILNAGRATLGTPLAGGVIAVRGMIELMSKGDSKFGISKLTAEQSDALLRNLRMGNVGMSLMLAGYFAPNMFGASHYYQKGVAQPEGMEEGDVKFFGLNIPRWLADNPYLVTMKVGASLRSSFDYYKNEKDKTFVESATSSLMHTGLGLVEETPVVGTPSEAIRWLEGNSGNWFWYSQVKSTLEPGLLQEIAEDTDNEQNGWMSVFNGTRIKRKPETTWEALKTGIPGLREEVEEK